MTKHCSSCKKKNCCCISLRGPAGIPGAKGAIGPTGSAFISSSIQTHVGCGNLSIEASPVPIGISLGLARDLSNAAMFNLNGVFSVPLNQIYYIAPRNGTLRNLYASIQSGIPAQVDIKVLISTNVPTAGDAPDFDPNSPALSVTGLLPTVIDNYDQGSDLTSVSVTQGQGIIVIVSFVPDQAVSSTSYTFTASYEFA